MTHQISEEAAFTIYQDLLDRICDAYFSNDFDAFRAAMHVPHHYETKCSRHRISTYEDLRQAFDCFREYLSGLGVTDFIRNCTGAVALSPTRIIGGHTTDLISNGKRLREPYEVWATLDLIDGKWMVTSSENAISETSWQALAFRQGADMNSSVSDGRANK